MNSRILLYKSEIPAPKYVTVINVYYVMLLASSHVEASSQLAYNVEHNTHPVVSNQKTLSRTLNCSATQHVRITGTTTTTIIMKTDEKIVSLFLFTYICDSGTERLQRAWFVSTFAAVCFVCI